METPKMIAGKTLDTMFQLQKNLVNHYITIEGLPEYPIDMNEKAGQRLIKDFVRRFTEELSEAYTELILATQAVEINNREQAMIHVEYYNEEIADATHFLMEILIYCGLDSASIDDMLGEFFNDHADLKNLYKKESPLETLLILGNYYNQVTQVKRLKGRADCFVLRGNMEILDNPQLSGGNRLSRKVMEEQASQLWNIVHTFNIFTHALNKREHHQSERDSINYNVLRTKLLTVLIEFARYLDFVEIGERSLFYSYYQKNQGNLERIKNNY
jgi:hypothetical protein